MVSWIDKVSYYRRKGVPNRPASLSFTNWDEIDWDEKTKKNRSHTKSKSRVHIGRNEDYRFCSVIISPVKFLAVLKSMLENLTKRRMEAKDDKQ